MKRYDLEQDEGCWATMSEYADGEYVEYTDVANAIQQARREGWEQCHRECVIIADNGPSPVTATMIAAIEYKELRNEQT